MQGYADSLGKALQVSTLDADFFTPVSILEKFSKSQGVMRFLRYVRYPMLIKSQKADVHHILDHGYAHLLPKITKGKTCITVHDLIPLLSWNGKIKVYDDMGEMALKFRKPYLNLYSLSFITQFDQIITPSQSTCDDLVEYLGADIAKITVIPPIIEMYFNHVGSERIKTFRAQYDLNTSVKWLMISGGGYYKNHNSCLKVLQKINQESHLTVNLIRTGIASDEFDNQVKKMGLSDHVKNIYLEDSHDLAILYSAVDCVLFPSLYEGFGMPVAEALACGTPVVTSNAGSLKEVSGDLAVQLDPYDINGLSEAVYRALCDPTIKHRAMAKGADWVRQFRRKYALQKIERVYTS